MHPLTRRSLRLTASDRARISSLQQRSGIDASSSEILLASLAHQRRQLPLEPEALEQLQAQLDAEDAAADIDDHITSFSLRDVEDVELVRLVDALGSSVTSTVRLALLVFSVALDSSQRSHLLTLPARARPGRPAQRLIRAS